MVADHHHTSARRKPPDRRLQTLLDDFELSVHLYAQSLERAPCRVATLPACRRRYGVFHDLHEIERGGEGSAAPRGYDEGCDARGPPFLPILPEDPGKVIFGVLVDHLSCGEGVIERIHPHVEGRVLVVRETSLGEVKLRRGHTEIEQDSVGVRYAGLHKQSVEFSEVSLQKDGLPAEAECVFCCVKC